MSQLHGLQHKVGQVDVVRWHAQTNIGNKCMEEWQRAICKAHYCAIMQRYCNDVTRLLDRGAGLFIECAVCHVLSCALREYV